MLKPYLDPVCGDRPQEIVFIGANPMDEAKIRAELDACLVDARRSFLTFGVSACPFPTWDRRAE